MRNRNLWNKNVPRVEYDYRARDARLRLERIERLLMRLRRLWRRREQSGRDQAGGDDRGRPRRKR